MTEEMTLRSVLALLATPSVIVGLVLAGAGYGLTFLWSVDVRDPVRLYGIAVVPGLAFLALLFGLRLAAGVASPVYPVLIADWLLFANVAFGAVIARRRFVRRRLGTGDKE